MTQNFELRETAPSLKEVSIGTMDGTMEKTTEISLGGAPRDLLNSVCVLMGSKMQGEFTPEETRILLEKLRVADQIVVKRGAEAIEGAIGRTEKEKMAVSVGGWPIEGYENDYEFLNRKLLRLKGLIDPIYGERLNELGWIYGLRELDIFLGRRDKPTYYRKLKSLIAGTGNVPLAALGIEGIPLEKESKPRLQAIPIPTALGAPKEEEKEWQSLKWQRHLAVLIEKVQNKEEIQPLEALGISDRQWQKMSAVEQLETLIRQSGNLNKVWELATYEDNSRKLYPSFVQKMSKTDFIKYAQDVFEKIEESYIILFRDIPDEVRSEYQKRVRQRSHKLKKLKRVKANDVW